VRPGWLVQTWPLGRQFTDPGRITGTPTGACRRSPRGEAPERAGEPDTAQVVGGSARLAADISTLETARVPTGNGQRDEPHEPARRRISFISSSEVQSKPGGGCRLLGMLER
jgi:hypothetical protein